MDLSAPYTDPLPLALDRELRAGERLLWHGRPLPRVAWGTLGIWLFAVPWTAFSLFWTTMAFAGARAFDEATSLSYAFPLFGLPFIAIGVCMLGMPFMPLFTARKTLFAVTSERLLRIYLHRRLVTRSVPGERIGEIDRSEKPDGSGRLKIAVGNQLDSDGDRRTDYFEIGEIADVMAADHRVRELAKLCRRERVSS